MRLLYSPQKIIYQKNYCQEDSNWPGVGYLASWNEQGQPITFFIPLIVLPNGTMWRPVYFFPVQVGNCTFWQAYYIAYQLPIVPTRAHEIIIAPIPHGTRINIRRLEELAEELDIRPEVHHSNLA